MARERKQSVINGAMILMLAVVLVKVIGALFKMPMTSLIGITGRGYFNSAYEIYTPIFAVSMAGLPVAVSRMVAESVALNRYRQARAIFNVSKKVFLVVGVAGTLILLAFAYPYARFVANIKSLKAILCVAPSIFLCCYMSAYRGYYEGLRNMIPTAISQVIEALGKLIIGLAFIKYIMNIGQSQFDKGMAASGDISAEVFGVTVTNAAEANGVIVPWAAAGAVLGVTIGSLLSLLFLMLVHKITGDGFSRDMILASPAPNAGGDIAKEMIKIAIPMVISSLILNATNLIDVTTIQARLSTAVQSDFSSVVEMHSVAINRAVELARLNIADKAEVVKYLWGAYGTALDFKSLVPTITIQLGVSALPALAAAWAVKNKDDMRSTVETVLKVGMLIALPAGIGIASLSSPILTLIYGRGNSSEAIPIIAPILAVYGLFTPIIAISIPVTNMLQAVGRADIPMKTVAVAAVVKIVLNYILVGIPKINIYGAVAGTVIFYILIVGMNMIFLLRISKVKVNWKNVFLKPLVSAVLCGITAFAAHGVIIKLFPGDTTQSVLNSDTLGTLVGIALAVVVYAITILLLKGFTREDISGLPKGEKIANLLEKYRLLG
ncbi:MAG: polysaccharide biosynthesis C-terminal domain-containing protein [Clostridia bacterium]|nr:polysaccharide biosynthesis C-terminal domain-containing protein [Clostridia bacterium]